MKYTVRASLAVALLAGFYLICASVLVALGLLLYEATIHDLAGALVAKVGFVTALTALAIGRGLFARRKRKGAPVPGLEVNATEQPILWAEVRTLAERAGTRAPQEIRLVPEVNAAVSEDSKLLGLIPGTRRLYVGVPLLVGLSAEQFRSVLAHELGHYSGRHTALAGVSYRGKESIGRVIGEVGADSWIGKLLALYGRVYLAVSHSVNRRQELEADVLSAELVGPTTAVSALRELPPLEAAWGHFLDSYVALGMEVDARPSDLFDGFRHFLADPERQRQMAEIREKPPAERRSIYDTHPTIDERVRALAAMPLQDHFTDSGPAVGLLTAPERTLGQFEAFLYDGSSRRAVPFQDLVTEAAAAVVDRNTGVLLRELSVRQLAQPTLRGVIDLLRKGLAHRLYHLVDGTEEQKKAYVTHLVAQAIDHTLVSNGAATHQVNWGGPWQLVEADGTVLDTTALAETALASTNGADALRAFLVDCEIPIDKVHRAPAPDPMTARPTRILGAIAPLRGENKRVLVVLDTGLLLRGLSRSEAWSLAKANARRRDDGANILRLTLEQPLDQLMSADQATYLPWPQVAAVIRRRGMSKDSRLTVGSADGRILKVKVGYRNRTQGDPWAAMAHFLGDRFTTK
jgi:Zn-dependent protease with chaperone function